MPCTHKNTKVIDSRTRPDNTVFRRRECLDCRERYTTNETVSTRTEHGPPESDDAREAEAFRNPHSELDRPAWSVISSHRVIEHGLRYQMAAEIRDHLWAEGRDEGLVVVPDEVADRMRQGKKIY